jgi:hypothetical protein
MSNFLEQLVAEWYEFQGYFVRRNVLVGKRGGGGYEGELDVVAFEPKKGRLVHIEASMDCDPWSTREKRFTRKFSTGEKYIPTLFKGFNLPSKPDQIALLMYAPSKGRETLGGGKLQTVNAFMNEIKNGIQGRQIRNQAVPEQFVALRALQFASNYWL